MEFKKFSVGCYSYGINNPQNNKPLPPGVTNVCFDDPLFY